MILNHVPSGYKLYPEQEYVLTEIERLWAEGYTAVVVEAPVASGKSLMARTLQAYAESLGLTSAYCVPDGVLQRQVQQSAPELASMWAATGMGESDYAKQLIRAQKNPKRLMNYMSPMGLRKALGFADVVIYDEAHKLESMLMDGVAVKLWRHEHHWPDVHTDLDVLEWIESKSSFGEKAKRLAKQRSKVARILKHHNAHIEKTVAPHRGKEKEVLIVTPLTPRWEMPLFWPKPGMRVVLMSATINKMDVHDLGLDLKHKVGYVTCRSPIPPQRREVKCFGEVDNRFFRRGRAISECADVIDMVTATHTGPGLVHVTYGEVEEYRRYLTHPRFLWHTKENKSKVFDDWVAGRLGPDRVLVGAGLAEGVDLKGHLARWQVVTKLQTPSLEDPIVEARAERDPAWYAWQTIKGFAQACGRVCRTPTDHGVTYVLDANVRRLYDDWTFLFPESLRDALRWP